MTRSTATPDQPDEPTDPDHGYAALNDFTPTTFDDHIRVFARGRQGRRRLNDTLLASQMDRGAWDDDAARRELQRDDPTT